MIVEQFSWLKLINGNEGIGILLENYDMTDFKDKNIAVKGQLTTVQIHFLHHHILKQFRPWLNLLKNHGPPI